MLTIPLPHATHHPGEHRRAQGRHQLRRPDLAARVGRHASLSAIEESRAVCSARLDRCSRAAGWGITSTLSHRGVTPTSLLASRPELGRAHDAREVRMILWFSQHGLVVNVVESAQLPALMAATVPAMTRAGPYTIRSGPAGSMALPESRPCGSRRAAARMPARL